MICWELNLISGFFAFFWLIVWVDGINKCGWCLAGGRGCWLKDPHQIALLWIMHDGGWNRWGRVLFSCLFFYLPFCLLFSHVCSLNFQALQRCMQGGSIKQNLVLWGIVISYITPVYPTLNCGKAEC